MVVYYRVNASNNYGAFDWAGTNCSYEQTTRKDRSMGMRSSFVRVGTLTAKYHTDLSFLFENDVINVNNPNGNNDQEIVRVKLDCVASWSSG